MQASLLMVTGIRFCLPSSSICAVLGYAVKDICTPTKGHREAMAGRHPSNILPWLLPGPQQEPSPWQHQPVCVLRGAQGQRQMGTQAAGSEGTPCPSVPYWAPQGQPQPLHPGVMPIRMSQCQSTFKTEGDQCLRARWEKAVQDGTEFIMGCLGNRGIQAIWGGTSVGKSEGQKDKQAWSV